jgi:hypothetical protein
MSDPQVVRPAEVLGVERPDDDFHQSAHKALCNQHDAALIRIAELERERDEAADHLRVLVYAIKSYPLRHCGDRMVYAAQIGDRTIERCDAFLAKHPQPAKEQQP